MLRLHRTPTFTCRTLGPDVHLKAELFQKTGSFKPRGMLNKVASLSDTIHEVRMSMLELRTTLARSEGMPHLAALNGSRLWKER